MSTNKTVMTDTDVDQFLQAVEPARRREDARLLDAMFRDLTGWQPRLWGPSIVGYGRYRYVYDSGRAGESLATGFSPRKAAMSVYIMPGYADMDDLLAELGPHKMGKSCLYLKSLSAIRQDVLEQIVRRGLDLLARRWEVLPA